MERWLERYGHVPHFMRDFHDQKLLFKWLEEIQVIVTKPDHYYFVNWVNAQIYVMDIFLWVMARRGWTLQRSRKNLQFGDIEADLQAFEKKRRDQFSQFMKMEREKNKDDG